MRRWLAPALLTLATGVMAAPAAVAGDRLCRQSVPSAAPQTTVIAGCEEAHCTAVGSQTLCACRNGDRWRQQRRQGKRLLQSWATEVSPMMGPAAFEVTLADVDGDGRAEWLVSRLQGMSNGLGVASHTLCVLWPQDTARAPVCRDVSEWQSLTVLVHEGGRQSCSLVDAGWYPGSEAGRGGGSYAVGQWLRLQDERWQAAPERSGMRRRLLRRFEEERATLPARNAQRLWYQHPSASSAACPGADCPP